jgi:mono/diheme cytochrome c family protein
MVERGESLLVSPPMPVNYLTVFIMKISSLYVASLALVGAVAFSPAAALAADLAKGQTIFATNCASCHGEKGAGDGPIAAGLPADQKPRNLQGSDMKFATTDAKFKELMKKGGAAVGLSMLMPAQPGLSDADVDNLLAYVNSLKKK